mgnify:CR=1 FL=1
MDRLAYDLIRIHTNSYTDIAMANQQALRTITVSDDRTKRMVWELHFALRQLSNRDAAMLLGAFPAKDFLGAVARRAINFAGLIAALGKGGTSAAKGAASALRNDEFQEHVGGLGRNAVDWTRGKVAAASDKVRAFREEPQTETLKVAAFALAALASLGGIDGDGGAPDIDIPLLGIGAHRSPFTHSILIGAGVETLIALLIRTSLKVHEKLPAVHDPVWDEFAKHGPELLDAVSRGASAGIAYHLMVDGLEQPAPYHGLPVAMPLEVHQALQAVNGAAEGMDARVRPKVHAKSDDMVAEHRSVRGRPAANR